VISVFQNRIKRESSEELGFRIQELGFLNPYAQIENPKSKSRAVPATVSYQACCYLQHHCRGI
jgi:hypothetical protein